MSWIALHQKLREDPKLFDFAVASNRDKFEAAGRLTWFWLWCVDHAEDGDLRNFNDAHFALAMELPSTDGKMIVEALTKAGFVERQPYFRIHNWWKYSGTLLKARYKEYPEKWQRVEELYRTDGVTLGVTPGVTPCATLGVTPGVTPCATPRNKPNKPILIKQQRADARADDFQIPNDLAPHGAVILEWLEYKRQRGQTYKAKGLEALWAKMRAFGTQLPAAIRNSMANNWAGLFVGKYDQLKPQTKPVHDRFTCTRCGRRNCSSMVGSICSDCHYGTKKTGESKAIGALLGENSGLNVK